MTPTDHLVGAQLKGALRHVTQLNEQTVWLIDLRNIHDLSVINGMSNQRKVAVISMIGGCDDPQVVEKASNSLKGFKPLAEWSSLKCYMAIIDPNDANAAQNKLHMAFFE